MKKLALWVVAIMTLCAPMSINAQDVIDKKTYEEANQLLNEANAAKNQQNRTLALAKYTEAFDLCASVFSYTDFFNLSYLHYLDGNYDDAIKFSERAAIKRPQDHKAYYNIAKICEKKGDLSRSIMYYKKAIDVDPQAISYNSLGNAYESTENYKEAVKCYEKALELTPDDAKLYVNMGLAYYKLGNIEKQEECYRQAADLGHAKAQEWLNGDHYKWGLTVINITQGKLVADK